MKRLWLRVWGIIETIGLGLGCLLLFDVVTISSSLGQIMFYILFIIVLAPLIVVGTLAIIACGN